MNSFDLIIIGGGPAGATAAIYATRYKLSTLIIAKDMGKISESYEVENYPGFEKISGIDLIGKMQAQAKKFGTKITFDKVTEIEKTGKGFELKTLGKEEFSAKALILATGLETRKLGLENEKQFHGKGLSYCYTCDAAFAKDETAGVVGGANSAAEAALLLADYAKKVYLFYRKDKLRAEPFLADKVNQNEKIEIIYNSTVTAIHGDTKLEKATIKISEEEKEIDLEWLFIEIGFLPDTTLADMLKIETDKGYIKVKADMSTNVKGVYAAGDSTTYSNFFNQVATAIGEGAIASDSVYKYLLKESKD